MIVEIKMISIGTTKITAKNRSELVFFGCMDRKRLVLGGPVRSPQYLGRSWTGCGPRLRVLGAKNRTEPDLKTLAIDPPHFYHTHEEIEAALRTAGVSSNTYMDQQAALSTPTLDHYANIKSQGQALGEGRDVANPTSSASKPMVLSL
jgi:hypothetical protein